MPRGAPSPLGTTTQVLQALPASVPWGYAVPCAHEQRVQPLAGGTQVAQGQAWGQCPGWDVPHWHPCLSLLRQHNGANQQSEGS